VNCWLVDSPRSVVVAGSNITTVATIRSAIVESVVVVVVIDPDVNVTVVLVPAVIRGGTIAISGPITRINRRSVRRRVVWSPAVVHSAVSPRWIWIVVIVMEC
jgi:hypothetical protein